MTEVTIRMRPGPRREGVRREARVHQRDGARGPLVRQLRIEGRDLARDQEALVDDRTRRQARDVEVLAAWILPVRDCVLQPAAEEIKFSLEEIGWNVAAR